MPISLSHLRRYAIARSLFKPTTLMRAIEKLGFVQADPIRAPARAQDLTLRHRVTGYRAGDLERRYPKLALEEDFFVNYGFLPRTHHALMHPRRVQSKASPVRAKRVEAILAFVRERGAVHPREVDAHFSHGRVTNWFGGSSNASTQLLDHMHYRGLLRVARRDSGTRVYIARETALPLIPVAAIAVKAAGAEAASASNMDALVDVIVRKYAPLPAGSLGFLVNRLQYGAPQWAKERAAALARAKQRLGHYASAASSGIGRQRNDRNPSGGDPTIRCACSRPLIPWCGTGAASKYSGTGSIASRPTRQRRNASWAITPCRCSGTIGSSVGAMWLLPMGF